MSKDFEELFACLRRRNVRALIVGGYAVAFHGQPRFTKDIDVFLEASPDNADRLLAALSDFGFGALGLTAGDFSTPGKIVQQRPLNVVPNQATTAVRAAGSPARSAFRPGTSAPRRAPTRR